MNGLLKKFGLLETLDLELSLSLEDVTDSLKRLSDEEEVSIFDIMGMYRADHKGTYKDINQKNKLPVHFDIYPRHPIIFLFGLLCSTLVASTIFLLLITLSIRDGQYTAALGASVVYLLFFFLFTIKPFKKMQWNIWDLRLDIEKELRRKEKQINKDVSISN